MKSEGKVSTNRSQALSNSPFVKSSFTGEDKLELPPLEEENAIGSNHENVYSGERNEWEKYKPVDRSEWWRREIKPNPEPGAYRLRTFLEELDSRPVRPTYGFKSDGRRREPGVIIKGEALLPGAYEHLDFIYWTNKSLQSCSFKNRGRGEKNILTEGLVDKSLENLSPGQYNVDKMNSIDGSVLPCNHSMFKSKAKRLPSKEFIGRPGPDPGLYEIKQNWSVPTGSIMRSKAARFQYSHTKVPGPGTYDRMRYEPRTIQTVANLGRNHGLFFSFTYH